MGHGVEGKATRTAVTGGVAERVAQMMQALATPSRVHLLGCLRDGPQSVGQLIDAVGLSQPAVSHQLRVLREMGFVLGERHGRRVLYRLHDEHVASLLDEAIWHCEHFELGAPTAVRASS